MKQKKEHSREELFEESIQRQLASMRQVPRKEKKKRQVSILALFVAGGMVLAALLRFLLGL